MNNVLISWQVYGPFTSCLLFQINALNRLLALGLNQPNVQHGNCGSTISGRGECRHLHHCLQVVIFLVEGSVDIYTIASR